MDIQNPVWKSVDQLRSDETHETGEAHDADIARPQRSRQRQVVLVARRKGAVWQHERFDARCARPLETEGVLTVRYDNSDRRVETAVCNGIDESLEIGSATRDEDP